MVWDFPQRRIDGYCGAMSQENVEIVRRAHAEFLAGLSRGDPAAAFDSGTVAPDFEWILPADAPGLRAVYRGREGFMEFMRTWTLEAAGLSE
jgi:ketosteroid isomerase-like protein